MNLKTYPYQYQRLNDDFEKLRAVLPPSEIRLCHVEILRKATDYITQLREQAKTCESKHCSKNGTPQTKRKRSDSSGSDCEIVYEGTSQQLLPSVELQVQNQESTKPQAETVNPSAHFSINYLRSQLLEPLKIPENETILGLDVNEGKSSPPQTLKFSQHLPTRVPISAAYYTGVQNMEPISGGFLDAFHASTSQELEARQGMESICEAIRCSESGFFSNPSKRPEASKNSKKIKRDPIVPAESENS